MQTIISPASAGLAAAFGDERLPERFWSKVHRNLASGCWEWTAHTGHNGYALFQVKRQSCRAHRVSYETLVGAIPEGLTLDHSCYVRHCVNPAHLEPVTQAENNRRAATEGVKINPRKVRPHCPAGHPYDEANTATSGSGKRRCKECTHARKRRYRAAARSASGGAQ